MRRQSRQEAEHADVADQQAELAVRRLRIERRGDGIGETVGGAQQVAQRRQHLRGFRGRPHGLAVAHQQRIVEMRAQPRQRLAQGRLGGVEPRRRPGQRSLAQHHLQHAQIAQLQLGFILIGHDHHSSSGIARRCGRP